MVGMAIYLAFRSLDTVAVGKAVEIRFAESSVRATINGSRERTLK